MSDGSDRLLSFGGVPFGSPSVSDVEFYEFELNPQTLPYGETSQMPANYQPFEFFDTDPEPLSDVEIVEADIQTYDWEWDDNQQKANYLVRFVVDGVTVSNNYILSSGDTSPLIVSL